MRVRCLHQPSELATLAEKWAGLAERIPFRRLEWLLPWWEHCRPKGAELYTLACFDRRGELAGVAPWYRAIGPLGRVIRPLGDGEVCSDYQGVLCRPGEGEIGAVAGALRSYLSGHRGWELLLLPAQHGEDAVLERLSSLLSERGHGVRSRPGPRTWRIELRDGWEGYLLRLSKSHRNRVRRALRQAEATGTRLRIAESTAELERGLRLLLELHVKRRRQFGQEGAFATAYLESFHHEVARSLHRDGKLWLAWVERDGRPLAIEYLLIGDRVAYSYQSGLNPSALDEAPGALLLALLIKRAIELGFHAYDLLRGDETYKAHFRAVPQPSSDLLIGHTHLAGRLAFRATVEGERLRALARRAQRALPLPPRRLPGEARKPDRGE